MPSNPPLSRRSRALFATAALCLALGACREDARFARREAIDPLPATLAAPAYLEPAPDAWELTRGGPAPVGRLASPNNAYAWAERAYALDHVFYEAPPDYGFDYEEIQPWAWETADDWTLYVEPLDVGNRYYYYEPGEDYPYFVRDPDYAYGFDDVGRIVVIYDVAGRLMPERYLVDRADLAGRYFTRAKALRRAAERAEHRRIAEDRWFARRESLTASQASWIQAAAIQDDWRRYRQRTDERDLRRFEPDRDRRVAETRRFEREWLEDRSRRDNDRGQGFLQRSGPDRIARADQPREDRRSERMFASRDDRDDRRAERMARADRAPDERREARAEGERRQERGRAEAEARRQRDDGDRRERAQGDRRQEQARIEGERRDQVQRERRAEGERRQAQAREGERRQEQARQERGRAEADARRQRAEGERREQAQREQRAEGERRQAQARAEGERRQEQARQERGRAEADARRQRAEGERREQAQREQRAEGERRQAQARADGERRQEQARQERARADTAERHAQPAADRQRSADRGNDGGGQADRTRGDGGGDRGHGRKKD